MICYHSKFYNVIILGFCFMFIFTAFQTCGIIQALVLKSIHDEDNSYTGNGYVSLAIIYACLSLANWLSPSCLVYTGPKLAMFLGGITYAVFIANFLYPMVWGLYTASVLIGFGAALIWTGQGNFLTLNSDSETMARNSGIFWAMLQCSLLFGNLFVFFEFQGEDKINIHIRTMVFSVLLGVGALGTILLLALRGGGRERIEDKGTPPPSPKEALVNAFKLFKTSDMILLSITFAYSGLELSFFSGVYGTCLGYTKAFGNDSNKYAPISGMLIGCGEILGGGVFGIFGKITNKFGRDPIIALGYVVHMVSFFLIFLNLPDLAPIRESLDPTYIKSSIYIALTCSFLLGFGDACFNTQMYSILGNVYAKDSASAFALFKFTQSAAAAIAFFYSDILILRYQLLILVVMGTVGTLTFFQVEWKAYRQSMKELDEQRRQDQTKAIDNALEISGNKLGYRDHIN